MFAELGFRVVAIDLNPQADLTSSFLEDDVLEELWEPGNSPRTIFGLIQPLLDRLGDIREPVLLEVDERIRLVPGNLGLSLFEDRLAETWGKCLDDNVANATDAFRVTTAFHRIMERATDQHEADVVLIDVGSNLGAINRAALVSSDHVVIPLAADLFSLQGLRNLGPTLRSWRKGWQTRKVHGGELTNLGFELPSGDMEPAGYVIMQPSVRERYPVGAYRRWIARIPGVYRTAVLGMGQAGEIPDPDPLALATLKNYRSLAPMAQEARKPMFALKPADGAIGGHVAAVQDCYRVIRRIATLLAETCELSSPLARAKADGW